MVQNIRKRPAVEPPLPLRSAKLPRSSTDSDLTSRWRQLGQDAKGLAVDTVSYFFGGPETSSSSQPRVNGSSTSTQCRPTAPPRRASMSSTFKKPADPQPKSLKSLPSQSLDSLVSTSSVPSLTNGDTSPSSSQSPNGTSSSGLGSRHYKRNHIFHNKHKARVKEMQKADLEKLTLELYELKRRDGYKSNLDTFKDFVNYGARLERVDQRDILSPSQSMTDLHEPEPSKKPPLRRYSDTHKDEEGLYIGEFLKRAIKDARESIKRPIPKPFDRYGNRIRLTLLRKDQEIEDHLRPKPPPLPTSLLPKEADEVSKLLTKRGLISKVAREQVSDKDLVRLGPSQWLNDEIINFYGQMILTRSEGAKENSSANGAANVPLRAHYFNTFFWPTLTSKGYDQGRLAKWTKKLDLFAKDIVLIPINHSNMHWTAAAINFREKRIESYDSMGHYQKSVFKPLRDYLNREHQNKKNAPFDFTGWVDYVPEETPQQENGFDCGVFTCQFMESCSRGRTFNFTQKDMPYLRKRMIWEIGNATFLDNP
ncbi:cysteine proteinase [Coniophora puteana RWD-64-598 SS2]|uniref:Cysteine proteinase n=1 Tax=Coniophora puteana (strain RWD-64-598) TaxID=741705 RepID=A0A5M3N6R5_CONPW|nr:cysteine proteinase [Coniophora puteana RWD-64-598 SS2]EIW86535.1 cysteine proteinase [Coniophora puteana RWD-64-598 SS2]